MKRFVWIAAIVTGSLLVVATVGGWLTLSSWVPTNGKALLIQELRRHGLDASIGRARYELFGGVILEDVRLLERTSQALWGVIPKAQIQIGWLAILLQQRVAFRGRITVEQPASTTLIASGSYHLRTRSLTLNVETTEIPLSSLGASLRRHVPPTLTDGTVRLSCRLTQPRQAPPQIAARLTGTGLVWHIPPAHLMGDLEMDLRAQPPGPSGGSWAFEVEATLHHGTLDGVPLIGTAQDLEGRARIRPERIEIDELAATALGSRWTLQGTVITKRASPTFEFLVTSEPELASLIFLLPSLQEAWQPEGRVGLRAVCRGSVPMPQGPDCLIRTELREVTLQGLHLLHPLSRLRGTLEYDVVSHRLSTDRLEGRIADHAVSARGDVRLTDPPRLDVAVNGELPIEAVAGWLFSNSALTRVGGLAAFDLHLAGSLAALRPTGRVELRQGQAYVPALSKRLEEVYSAIRFEADRIDITNLSLRLEGQPITANATIALEQAPRISGTFTLPEGRLQLTGRLSPNAYLIEKADLALRHSRLELKGSIAREPQHPSRLSISGLVELGELHVVPFVPLPRLQAWGLKGLTQIEANLQGVLSEWPAVELSAHLLAEDVQVRDVPVTRLTCEVQADARGWRARIPSALIAGGALKGELSVEPRPEQRYAFLAQADLIRLNLATLGQAIPAWRSRAVAGEASAHAAVSGIWRERPTWRGDGWVNAEGERLGELPLLEKVFQGLFGLLADRLRLDTLRRAQIHQASARWRLAQGRLSSDDLRLGGLAGTEPVAVYGQGSVGLDGTLDFVIEPELSEGMLLQAPTTSSIAGTVLKAAGGLERFRRLIGRHRLTGTLKQPEYHFELSTQEIFKQLVPGPADFFQQLFDAVR